MEKHSGNALGMHVCKLNKAKIRPSMTDLHVQVAATALGEETAVSTSIKQAVACRQVAPTVFAARGSRQLACAWAAATTALFV